MLKGCNEILNKICTLMVTLQRKQGIIDINYIISVKHQQPSHDSLMIERCLVVNINWVIIQS